MQVNSISFQQGRQFSVSRSNWDKTKVDTTLLANIEAVQTNIYYLKAKKGSFQDARQLALAFYTNESLEKLRELYREPIIVPVMAEEKQGKNAIPLGMADVMQGKLGWKVTKDIIQTNKAGHTKANGWYRIASHATFSGKVIVGGKYFIVDDFIGMGGTIAGIKSFIELSGGLVVGCEILTGRSESAKLYLRESTLTKLRERHGEIEQEFKLLIGFKFEHLTESEAQYLLRSKSIERIRNQITKAVLIRDGG